MATRKPLKSDDKAGEFIEPLSENEHYMRVVAQCRKIHKDLLQAERKGQLNNDRENPVNVGKLLMRLRLNASWLLGTKNDIVDMINERMQYVAAKRQEIYETELGKGSSDNAAKTRSQELTRMEEAQIDVLKNQKDQINDEYKRFDGICISMQSILKDFVTERMMG